MESTAQWWATSLENWSAVKRRRSTRLLSAKVMPPTCRRKVPKGPRFSDQWGAPVMPGPLGGAGSPKPGLERPIRSPGANLGK